MYNNGELHTNPFSRMGSEIQRSNNLREFGNRVNPEKKHSTSTTQRQTESTFGVKREEIKVISDSPSPSSAGRDSDLGDQNHALVFTTALPYPVEDTSTDRLGAVVEEIDDSPLLPNWEHNLPGNRQIHHGDKFASFMAESIPFSFTNNHQNDVQNSNMTSGEKGSSGSSPGMNPFHRAHSLAYKEHHTGDKSMISPQKDESVFSSSKTQTFEEKAEEPVSSNKKEKTSQSPSPKEKFDEKLLAQRTFAKRRAKLIWLGMFVWLLMVLAPVSIFLMGTSCRNSESICLPQFTLQLEDSSSEAKGALESAREALKVLSYVAIDLGSNIDEVDDDTYLQTVNTFSPENIYALNFLGYCRDNLISEERFCIGCFGMDIVSTLIRDSGIQLARLIKRPDFAKIGESFVLAYKVLLNSIAQDNSTTLTQKGGFIDKAKLLERINLALAYLLIGSFSLSAINAVYYTCLILLPVISRKPKFLISRLRSLTTILILVQFMIFTVLFVIWIIEVQYVLKIKQLNTLSGVVNISYHLGIYVLELTAMITAFNFLLILGFHRLTKI